MNNEIIKLFDNCAIMVGNGIRNRKFLARAYKNTGDYKRAIKLLITPPNDRKQIKLWFRNLNEIANLLPKVGHHHIADLLNSLFIYLDDSSSTSRRASVALMARVRRAKKENLCGNMEKCLDDFGVVFSRDHVESLITLSVLVDAYTWNADALKLMGNYREAICSAKKAVTESFYANQLQHAYAIWKLAEIQLLSGEDEDVVVENLNLSVSFAELTKNGQAKFWILTTYGSLYNEKYTDIANENLAKANQYRQWDKGGGELFYLLHEAERNRISGNYALCFETLDKVITIEKNKILNPRRYKSARLAALLITAECKRVSACSQQDSSDAQALLEKVRKAYEKAGIYSAAARAETSIAIIDGKRISNDRIEYFKKQGWYLEARRALAPNDQCNEPWRILM